MPYPWRIALGVFYNVYNETDYILDTGCFPGLEFTQNWLGRSAPPTRGRIFPQNFSRVGTGMDRAVPYNRISGIFFLAVYAKEDGKT